MKIRLFVLSFAISLLQLNFSNFAFSKQAYDQPVLGSSSNKCFVGKLKKRMFPFDIFKKYKFFLLDEKGKEIAFVSFEASIDESYAKAHVGKEVVICGASETVKEEPYVLIRARSISLGDR